MKPHWDQKKLLWALPCADVQSPLYGLSHLISSSHFIKYGNRLCYLLHTWGEVNTFHSLLFSEIAFKKNRNNTHNSTTRNYISDFVTTMIETYKYRFLYKQEINCAICHLIFHFKNIISCCVNKYIIIIYIIMLMAYLIYITTFMVTVFLFLENFILTNSCWWAFTLVFFFSLHLYFNVIFSLNVYTPE